MLRPKPGILSIAPYEAGKSEAGGGERTIKLSSNETPLGPSPQAIEAFRKTAVSLHRYPDGHAAALREAIGRVHGLDPARIVCGAGSDELIGLLIHAYAGPGDEVLYSAHGFLMYKIYTQAAGAAPVTAPEQNLTADVDALLAQVTPRTRIVFVANPNNPTGTYVSRNELARLRRGLPEDVLLAVDAAYAEYATHIPEYGSGHELVDSAPNTVMLRTFSKIYGLAALRLGWAYGPAHVVDVLHRVRGPFNVSAPAMAAGAAAVRDTAYTASAHAFNRRWLGWLTDECSTLGLRVTPSAGNFLLLEFPQEPAKNAASANAFLTARHIIPRMVAGYGLSGHLRITVGLEEENRALVEALRAFLGR